MDIAILVSSTKIRNVCFMSYIARKPFTCLLIIMMIIIIIEIENINYFK